MEKDFYNRTIKILKYTKDPDRALARVNITTEEGVYAWNYYFSNTFFRYDEIKILPEYTDNERKVYFALKEGKVVVGIKPDNTKVLIFKDGDIISGQDDKNFYEHFPLDLFWSCKKYQILEILE